jgi:hypothetical protein
MASLIAVWVALLALLGFYSPGEGLHLRVAQVLLRNTYAVIATIAVLAIFAVGFQWAEMLSYCCGNKLQSPVPRLVLFFLGLLLLAPLT